MAVGKSTLLNHLNPFPDGSSSFIPDKTAEKILMLFNDGDNYYIHIISPADAKGRKTTKAYIKKNGIELNENGNVSSYKDIIFSEFELDSNYISLSRLSSTDRGLGDKTPAERKRFTSNIIENLEIYNNMYKTLNKKSLVYKSHINTLHTKIQNIGDKASLDQRLVSLRSREGDLNAKILDLNNRIVSIQAKNSIDEEEAKEIQLATEESDRLKSKLDTIQNQLDIFYNRTKINKEEIVKKYNSDKDLYTTYNAKLEELSNTFRDKSNRLSEVSNNILSIEAEVNSSITNDTITEIYKESNNKIKAIESDLKKLNIPNDTSLIIELTNINTFCNKFILLLDKFNDDMSSNDIKYLVTTYTKAHYDGLGEDQRKLMIQIEDLKVKISDIQGQMKILATLEDRPTKCKIDSCPFISDALKLKKSLKVDLISELDNLQQKILKLSGDITEIQKEIDYCAALSSKKMELDTIRSTILENEHGLRIFIPEFLKNIDKKLIEINPFNEIRDNSRLVDGLNLLKMLEDERNNNKVLEAEYKGYREKIQLLNSSKVMLEKLKKEEVDLSNELKNLRIDIDEYNKTISDIKERLSIETQYANIVESYKDKESDYKIAKSKVDSYEKKSSKALEALSNINEYRADIETYSKELNPIIQDINTISGQLTLLDSYYIEFNEYKASYDIIETLKKYCSPTGGGIQTLFMQIYMSKTKDTANQILSMLFRGSYQLLDFVINENEFRIPFIGEGLPVDDISSGSGAQISMMSMILNLVLLHQGSTKFNIAQLDELTSNLDVYNNSVFVNVLLHCIQVLELEQVFIISHSLDIDDGLVDIIDLGGLDEYSATSSNKNIIWSFNIDGKQ